MKNRNKILIALVFVLELSCSSSNDAVVPPVVPPVTVANDVDFWLTKGDQSVLLAKQTGNLGFNTIPNSYPNIEVNAAQKYQTIDGFGYTLTGGSASVINQLNATKKAALLQELFGTSETAIGVSYIRISIGASDLNSEPFTYDDIAVGDTDLDLAKFSLDKDRNGVLALLKQILTINPRF